MQITTTPTVRATAPAPQAPAPSTPTPAPADKVSLGQHPSWKESAFGKAGLTIGRNVGLTGGLAGVGALSAQAGRLGVLGAAAGAAALGYYLSKDVTFQDDVSPKWNRALGASLATGAALIGVVPSQVGGLQAGLIAAGILGGIGVFRGVLEVASDHNLV